MAKLTRLIRWIKKLDLFAVVEKLLTLAALALVAISVGGQLGQMLGLRGAAATTVGWSIALVYDALWIGALRMSEVAIRQRSRIGMAVMLGLTAAAIGVSTFALWKLGHAQVFAGVPAAAAVFMGLRLFADNMLADADTASRIADQSAAARNAHAVAAADARHLASGARTDVLAETAEHLAEMARQIARAEVLTEAQKKISKARAKAEDVLAEADKEHGEKAAAFLARELIAVGSHSRVTPEGHTPPELEGHTGVTQVSPKIEAVTEEPVTLPELPVEQVPAEGGMDLSELAEIARVELPERGVSLSDAQLEVVLRWLRYAMEPPRSYRQAQDAFRSAGFRAKEERIRRIWGEIETREAEAVPA
ncbi:MULTISPECIES: hypothetical protein [unclassified Streptomyces]|uniref:hypothetical protein n=1 Tax=unclassified Streptomyces TaxID=2593676 RepID=UPI002271D2D7|nr:MULTISPECIES: hypothetical protein [unclassified Streptomyces]MCY0917020.1 hypothetical protein [Streptomyces sp. H27-G5]MCY0959960.1 hypothetical protein [Streptomyces sp. H27-H5]